MSKWIRIKRFGELPRYGQLVWIVIFETIHEIVTIRPAIYNDTSNTPSYSLNPSLFGFEIENIYGTYILFYPEFTDHYSTLIFAWMPREVGDDVPVFSLMRELLYE